MDIASAQAIGRATRYGAIAGWLADQCAVLPPGSQLPSEAQLAELFHVSRMTARQALERVRAMGLVVRRLGVGSFVADPRNHLPRQELLSFSDEARARGMVPGAVVLEAHMAVLPADAALMGLDPRAPLVRIERIRLADGEAVCLEKATLPGRLAPVLERDLGGSLHAVLQDLGERPASAEGLVTARIATEAECWVLGLEPPIALLVDSRIVRDAEGLVVLRSESAYVGTRWALDTALPLPSRERPPVRPAS